jgi:hypothetical protein
MTFTDEQTILIFRALVRVLESPGLRLEVLRVFARILEELEQE